MSEMETATTWPKIGATVICRREEYRVIGHHADLDAVFAEPVARPFLLALDEIAWDPADSADASTAAKDQRTSGLSEPASVPK